MSVTEEEKDRREHPRRTRAVAVLVAGLVALGIAVAVGTGSDGRSDDAATVEATDDRPTGTDGRTGDGRDREVPDQLPGGAGDRSEDPSSSDPTTVGRASAGGRGGTSGTSGGSTATRRGRSSRGGDPASGPSSPAPATTAAPRPADDVVPLPDGRDRTTPSTPIVRPDAPNEPPEAEACANLGLVPIGDATGGDAGIVAAAPRFRAMAAGILASEPMLVCARPIEPWRDDLYVQSLRAGGQGVGILVAGREQRDPVLRLNRYEWAAWGWRSDHNFVGVPTRRTRIDGVPVILTSRGGVVIEHPASMAIPVVNGAWGMWMQRGGPSGDMGMPAGRAQGLARIATWQDFVGGRVVVPAVETDIEAESQPLDRYSWVPWSAFGDPPPIEVRAGSVIENAGASYYVAADGMRYWIRTADDWFCARDSGARMLGNVEGRVLVTFPIGGEYRCGM